jgi:ABC-type lipoprotein release transport system permease subunit
VLAVAAASEPPLGRRSVATEVTGDGRGSGIATDVVTGLLASVVAAACAVPAWRASRIDPRVALSE